MMYRPAESFCGPSPDRRLELADVGIGGEQLKSVGDGVDHSPGGFQAAASLAM
jgi:hypothetical protein